MLGLLDCLEFRNLLKLACLLANIDSDYLCRADSHSINLIRVLRWQQVRARPLGLETRECNSECVGDGENETKGGEAL
ncbi:hypothetical protein HRI_000430700 [Hibiscus trionum]|uniref:Uncharacterized protein n=1 Tax=Hibiscus trionum TaxID=183268 RepID=A0A9W7GXZ8_HIBTR|nr:hypothetical protein HRI_000430700 [Hibiscus trionum]